jgi:hypothetical protein
MTMTPSTNGGSGSFQVRASDGGRWWLKPINNLQSPRVTINEYLVGRVGALCGAPVCNVKLILIPEEFAGWQFRPGHHLVAGIANASQEVRAAREDRALVARTRDDNRTRHAGVFALYDWCFGGDPQWLYAADDDEKTYSHDHGMYLPGADSWTEETLLAHVDKAHELGLEPTDLSKDAVEAAAAAIEASTTDVLAPILCSVPQEWPVTNRELAVLGYFLERRAPGTAGRVRAMMGV